MDNAILNQKNDIAKWLYSIGYTCSINALYHAIRYKDLDLVKWLCKNIKFIYTSGDIYNLKQMGNYEINKWIRLNVLDTYEVFSNDSNNTDKKSDSSWELI